MNLIIKKNSDELSIDFAVWMADYIEKKLQQQSRFTIVLAGGNTPKKLYQLLATEEFKNKIDWSKLHFFWGDERYVPFTDEKNNAKMVFDNLLNHIAIAKENYINKSLEKKEEIKREKAIVKAKYEIKLKENEVAAQAPVVTPGEPNFRIALRSRLFGAGKVGDDMKFAYVTGDNIRGVYQNFVDVVADNKNTFSREDWDEINVLYEALDTRKNVVEKDLATNDNIKIAGLKVRYASIAATHRGGTKVKENTEAKQ